MKIHLMGIGGTGMASLAGMLKDSGHEVTGSDTGVYPPMSLILEEMKIPVLCPYQESNLAGQPDLVVIGNVISRGNAEAEAVLERQIPYESMPEAIRKLFLQDKTTLVIAGTHGKTTTTCMLSWVLESAGRDPGFFVGGKPKNFPKNFKLGGGEFFALEGDEYDTAFFDKGPKFLHYQPKHVLLTSVEFDHADIYDNLEQIIASFRKLLKIIPQEGSLIANLDYPSIAGLLKDCSAKVISYGMNPENRDRVDYFGEILQTGEKLKFRVTRSGDAAKTSPLEVEWDQSGAHNVSNALGVIALCENIGLSWEEIHSGLLSFQGVKRRQELLGEVNGIILLDDFAHHPTSVQETIMGIRKKYPSRRLWAIFEPRSNTSKRDIFQEDYAKSFAGADQVIFSDVFMPEKVKVGKVMDVGWIVGKINDSSRVSARHLSGTKAILDCLVQESKPGDALLFMSNGDFDGLAPKTLATLKTRAPGG